jgi:serine/threonine protein kinase
MIPTDCPGLDAWKRLIHGQGAPEDSAALEQHLSECSACTSLLEQWQRLDPILQALRGQQALLGETESACLGQLRLELAERWKHGPSEPDTTPGVPGTFGYGRYQVVKPLGQGGMGAVYEGLDPELQRRVAIKVLRPDLGLSPSLRERFKREALAVGRLNHPNIVPIYDVGEEQSELYFVMALLPGDSLKNKGRLPLEEVISIGLGIARGLAAAHEAGILHRDVTPANVQVEQHGGLIHVRLLDFGLSRINESGDSLTPSGMMLGTPGYAAPENINGQGADGRCDLFGLGVILYKLAAGKKPWEASDLTAYIKALALEKPVPLDVLEPAIPRAFSDLVSRLIEVDPAHRPNNCLEVITALEGIRAALNAAQPSSLPPTVIEPAPSHPSRRKVLPVLAAVTAALATAGVGAWIVGTTSKPSDPPKPPAVIGVAEVLGLIVEDLESTPEDKRKERRYLTLAHRSDRQRVTEALDTLPATGAKPFFRPLGDAEAVLAFDLATLGWSEDDWAHYRAIDPYGLDLESHSDPLIQARMAHVRRLAGCRCPFVRGDWLLVALSGPPLGGVPRTRVGLEPPKHGPWIDLVQDYPRERLNLEGAAQDLGVSSVALAECIRGDRLLSEKRRLRVLLEGGSISRRDWEDLALGESSYQAASKKLGLGVASFGE